MTWDVWVWGAGGDKVPADGKMGRDVWGMHPYAGLWRGYRGVYVSGCPVSWGMGCHEGSLFYVMPYVGV